MSVNADAWCSPKKRDNDGVSSSFQQTTKCLHRRKQNDPLNCGAKSVQYLGQDEHFPAVSALTPKFGRDWTTLVTLAAGVQEIPFCDQSSKGSPSLQRQNELAAAVASATSVDIATSSPEPNTVFTIAHHNSMHSVAFSALDFTSHSALGHLLVDDSHPATSDSANFNQTKPLLTVPIPLPYSGEEKSRGPSVRPLKNVAGEKRKDSPTFNATGGEKQPRTSAFAHIFPSSSSATSVLAANILPAEGFEMDSNLILPHEANRAVRAEDFCLNTTDFTSLF